MAKKMIADMVVELLGYELPGAQNKSNPSSQGLIEHGSPSADRPVFGK